MSEEQGLTQDPRDQSGKIRVQETCRPLGYDTYFTGAGDDPSSISNVGGGQRFIINHRCVNITNVQRTSNVAIITTQTDHRFSVNDLVDVSCDDSSFNTTSATVTELSGTTILKYSNTGSDVDSKSATGTVGDKATQNLYIDCNMVNNATFVHEGYLTWSNANFDYVTLEIVPRTTAYTSGTNTNYNLYGGYLIIPAAGNGTIQVTADLSVPNNGLVYIPNGDLGTVPVAYWDATWNSVSSQYTNIAPNATASGRYNMFGAEVTLKRFANKLTLLCDGFIMLQSADTAQIGHGMRLKATAVTYGTDHPWKFSCLFTMHRQKTC